MNDYYALLNVPASAAVEDVKKALHREMRQWTNRTNAPQIERRQEAERRVKLLEQAEVTLLDPAKRAQYDRELGGGAAKQTAPELDLAGVSNLIEEARRLLDRARVADALFVARKAVDAEPQNPEAWVVLGTAFSSDGEAEKAIDAYRRAIDLRPNVASYHFELGSIFETAEQWSEALRSYERAYKIDASVAMYRAAYAVVLVKMGDPAQGIGILEQCVQQEPDNAAYQWFLAIAYRESAYLGWTYVAEGQKVGLLEIPGRYATSIDHVTLAQDALTNALSLKFNDAALTEELTQLKKDVDGNTKRKFMGNWFVGGAVALLAYFMGKEGIFLFCAAILYLGVSFVPWYVINSRLANGHHFDDFGWISQTFNKGDNNLVMMGIGIFLMIFALPVFAVYNLYRYHGDAIRRFATSSQNKDRASALMAKLQGVAKQTAGAASGAISNLASGESGKSPINRKLVLCGVGGVVAVAAVAFVGRQFASRPEAPAAPVAPAAKLAPVASQSKDVALLTAKLSAAEQCLTRKDIVCATSNVDEVVKLDPQNVAAAGMQQRIAKLAKLQQDALAKAQAQEAAAQEQARKAQEVLAQAQQAPPPAQAPLLVAPAIVPPASNQQQAQQQVQQPPAQAPAQPAPTAVDSVAPAVTGAAATMALDAKSGCRVWKPNLVPNDQVAWSGPCAAGLASGLGVATWSTNGKVALSYEGTFRAGLLQGRGKMAAGGDWYDGEYRDGKRDGRGTYVSGAGERYEGEFKDNRREGHGLVTRADGSRVEGLFRDGKMVAQTAPSAAPDANAAPDKAARESKARAQADSRATEAERQRAAQAQRPAVPPARSAAPPQPVAVARSVKEVCSGRSFFNEQICRVSECATKPEFANDPICLLGKNNQQRQPQ